MAAVPCSGSTPLSASSAEQLVTLGKEQVAQGKASDAKKTFERAVKSDPDAALAIGDFYQAEGATAAASNQTSTARNLHDNARHFYKTACERQMLTPPPDLLTRLADEYNELSHLSSDGYDAAANAKAETFYTRAEATDPSYYPAHVGRLIAFLDRYNHTLVHPGFFASSNYDANAFNGALMELADVVRTEPTKQTLLTVHSMFGQPIDATGEELVIKTLMPVLHNILLTQGGDPEIFDVLAGAYLNLLFNHPWSAPAVLEAVHDFVQADQVNDANVGTVLRLYHDLIERMPDGGLVMATDLVLLRRARLAQSPEALVQLMELYKLLVSKHLANGLAVSIAIEDLYGMAHDCPRRAVVVPAGQALMGIGQAYPAYAAKSFELLAQIALEGGPKLCAAIIKDLHIILNSRQTQVQLAAARTLRALGVPDVDLILIQVIKEQAVQQRALSDR